jgi:MFS family permease
MSQSSSPAGVSNGPNKVWSIRFLLLIAGLGGLLFGIDVGIIAGALPYLVETSGLNANQISFIVAAVLLGGLLSTLFAGVLCDWLGRRTVMTFSGILFVVSVFTIALSQDFTSLILGRLLQGVTIGLIGVAAPLYLAECLSASSRGKGTAIFQWLLTLGIVAAALIGLYFSIRVKNMEKLGDAAEFLEAHGKAAVLAYKDFAWRSIFWVSLPPGILFVLGSLIVPESPRWYFRRGRKDAARTALLFSRSAEQADRELQEMEETAAAEKAKATATGQQGKESLLHRKYVIPFVLACIILACNQSTGINSIIQYCATIFIKAGLNDEQAHIGNVILTLVNFLLTIVAIVLVDRKGRKFLLSIGSGGIIVSMICVGLVFHNTERLSVDCKGAVQGMVSEYRDVSAIVEKSAADVKAKKSNDITLSFADSDIVGAAADLGQQRGKITLQFNRTVAAAKLVKEDKGKITKLQVVLAADSSTAEKPLTFPVDAKVVAEAAAMGDKVVLTVVPKMTEVKLSERYPKAAIQFDRTMLDRLLAETGDAGKAIAGKPATLTIIYGCGDFVAATNAVRSDDEPAKRIEITRDSCVPGNAVEAFFKNPLADLTKSKGAPIRIDNATITPVPSVFNGWLTAGLIFTYCGFFAVGPGVCVWLALSELMPTRIRSNGMSVAQVLNQSVSTTIAAIFLPTVGKYGYATMFYAFAAFTVIYFITAAFLLPETKGKTLEEIEEHFSGQKRD